jgi:hypothetical protein
MCENRDRPSVHFASPGSWGGGWTCSRALTSLKTVASALAGKVSSRLAIACSLTCNGEIHSRPSWTMTRCTSAMAPKRRHTKLTTRATITGKVKIRARKRIRRSGLRGSRRSSWRGANNAGVSNAVSSASISATAGNGPGTRCRKSGFPRRRLLLFAISHLVLSLVRG